MNEDFLHFIWKNQLFDQKNLTTHNDEEITIIEAGEHNHNSGPDFFNSRIKISGTTWAGNVEIHIQSSDWDKHLHQFDPAYNNVILHVVYEHDHWENSIPVFELKDRIDPEIHERYIKLQFNSDWIPCANSISNIHPVFIQNWISRMGVERLQKKCEPLEKLLKENNYDWQETFYIQLARNFGFRTNADPFELLARTVPYRLFKKCIDKPIQIESLLFGTAGFLMIKCKDNYFRSLKAEYEFLSSKYSLKAIPFHSWKFLRMRPANFPGIRIAQFSSLLKKEPDLLKKILEIRDINEYYKLFSVGTHSYWNEHFVFGKRSASSIKTLGNTAIDNIIINTVIPFLYLYSIKQHSPEHSDFALYLLEQIPAEENVISRNWKKLGVTLNNCLDSQAIIYLTENFCRKSRCLECNIGKKILIKNETIQTIK